MKKIILSFFFITLINVCAWASPRIVFDKTAHNFGKIRPDTNHSVKFVFHNRGTSTLVIERLRAG